MVVIGRIDTCGKCLYCKKHFNYRKACQKGLYCSNSCQKNHESDQKYLAWIGGWQPWKTEVSYKRAVIKRDGYKCNECKISEWNFKTIGLELEHKDGNFKNNLQENLCLLCPNCHSQTSTFKHKNKGNGRESRRKLLKHCGDAAVL